MNRNILVNLILQCDAKLAKLLEFIVAILLMVLFALLIYLISLRYFFNDSLIGGDEVLRIIFVHATALGVAIALGRREHVTITLIMQTLAARWQRIFDLIGIFSVIVFNGVLLINSVLWIDKTGFYTMPALDVFQIYYKIAIPLSCLCAILFGIIRFSLVLLNKEAYDWGGVQE